MAGFNIIKELNIQTELFPEAISDCYRTLNNLDQ